jgi:NADH-quinone oxidoreductase subunit F
MTENVEIIYRDIDVPGIETLEVYESRGGYDALRKVLSSMKPEEVVEAVKGSRLVGRGGAGFSTGLKWQFVRSETNEPKYVVCNAEEGEPGTFKDRPILEKIPHRLVEAMIICSYAVGAHEGYVVFRGEFVEPARIVNKAIAEAREKGYLGENILGSGHSYDMRVFRTAGAYICGEESALLEAMEGKAGLCRIRPPFPVNAGLWAKPTALNNVETFANVPDIILKGAEWYSSLGTENTSGTKGFCVSGQVKKPGVYELPLGITMRELIYEHAGGILDDKEFKAVFPGGASSSCLLPEHLDIPLDFTTVWEAGSALGSAAFIVIAEGVCMVSAALRLARFFEHESCGKCLPCREGTYHMVRTLEAIHAGEATEEDVDNLADICRSIEKSAFCGLGQAAICPVLSTIEHFREEYMDHLKNKGSCKARG